MHNHFAELFRKATTLSYQVIMAAKKQSKVEPSRHSPKDLGEAVRVGSAIGVTLPIGDTTAHFRTDFWHERIAPKGTQEEIRKTFALVDEANKAELERRVAEYRRMITRILGEEVEDEDDEDEAEETPSERAKRRLREG